MCANPVDLHPRARSREQQSREADAERYAKLMDVIAWLDGLPKKTLSDAIVAQYSRVTDELREIALRRAEPSQFPAPDDCTHDPQQTVLAFTADDHDAVKEQLARDKLIIARSLAHIDAIAKRLAKTQAVMHAAANQVKKLSPENSDKSTDQSISRFKLRHYP